MNKKKILTFILLINNFNLCVYGDTKGIDILNDLISTNNSKNEFVPTTKINGSLFFTFGALDSPSSREYFDFTYENKIKINTSFTGSDKLLTIIESGNAMESPLNIDLQSKKGDKLKISTLLYQFQIGNGFEAIIGPKMFGYNGLSGKSTAYNERIAILDGSNYTTSSGIGPGVGISKRNKNGFNVSLKLASNDNQIKDETTHFISQIGFTKKNFGGTITSNLNNEFNAFGIAAFYKYKKFPSISASIEQKEGDSIKTTNNWIIGLQKNLENKKYGLAVGTYNSEENICYEAWSEVDITDKSKVIPVFFIREKNNINDEFGFAINYKFNY
tara:strand:- start:474 stop:1463 length:990 start_codon:yes stop_codon:yes gene_type:complete